MQVILHSWNILECSISHKHLQEETFPAKHPIILSAVQILELLLRTFQTQSWLCCRNGGFKPYPLMPSLYFSGFINSQLLPSSVYTSCALLMEDTESLLVLESNDILSPAHLGATYGVTLPGSPVAFPSGLCLLMISSGTLHILGTWLLYEGVVWLSVFFSDSLFEMCFVILSQVMGVFLCSWNLKT